MIAIHKNLKKHFHEGVVYEDKGVPRKLMIINVNYGCRSGDPKATFNLAHRFDPGIPMDQRPCHYGTVLFENVLPEKLFRNITEWLKFKVAQNETRIEALKSKIESEKSKIEDHRESIARLLEVEFYKKILNDNFIKVTKEYQAGKKMTLSIFKSFFNNLKGIDFEIESRSNRIAKSKKEILEAENELKQLLDFNHKASRKQRSFEARKQWNLEHQGE